MPLRPSSLGSFGDYDCSTNCDGLYNRELIDACHAAQSACSEVSHYAHSAAAASYIASHPGVCNQMADQIIALRVPGGPPPATSLLWDSHHRWLNPDSVRNPVGGCADVVAAALAANVEPGTWRSTLPPPPPVVCPPGPGAVGEIHNCIDEMDHTYYVYDGTTWHAAGHRGRGTAEAMAAQFLAAAGLPIPPNLQPSGTQPGGGGTASSWWSDHGGTVALVGGGVAAAGVGAWLLFRKPAPALSGARRRRARAFRLSCAGV